MRGIRTAGRISALADEVDAAREVARADRQPRARAAAARRDSAPQSKRPACRLLATIPLDPRVTAFDAAGDPVAAIPQDAPARVALAAMLDKLFPNLPGETLMSIRQLKAVSLDPATNEMVQIAGDAEIPTVFDRYKAQHPQCKFGTDGVCCRLCHMGPCRITPKAKLGICGADADTITARNLLREIAAGTAAHSDHGRMLVRTLKMVAQGKGGDYKIADPCACAKRRGSSASQTDGRDDLAIAGDLADFFMTQFAWSEEPNATLKLAPEKRQALWKKLGIEPARNRLRPSWN